jgi:hypothetical protein
VAAVRLRGGGGPGAWLAPTAEAECGTDGSFRIGELAPGDYRLEARAHGFAPASVEAGAPSEGVTIRVAIGGALLGQVRDSAGRAVAAFTVVVTRRRGPLERGESETRSVLDGEGRYRVDGLPPGRYLATVAARGWASPREREVEIRTGEARLDFTLSRGGRLLGRVSDAASKQALAGALVTMEGSSGDSGALPTATSARTGADGRFTLDGLAPGLSSIMVAADGHHGRLISGLRSDGASDLGPIEVALDATAPGEAPHIELVGIGAVLSARGEVLVVGQVFPGGGAAEVGIQPGDAILAIDGDEVAGLGFVESVQRIRGPESSSVRLTLRRGEAAPYQLDVPRRRVHG